MIQRLSTVFELEEYEYSRQVDVEHKDSHVSISDANFTWGYKVKQEKSEAGPKMQVKLNLETISQPVLQGINFSMKPGDFLTVVGQVGSGKTSLLYSIM